MSDSSFPPISDDVLFSAVEIDLTGYEAWLRLGSINSVRTESSISVEYRKSDPITFEFEDGQVSIDYKLLGPIIGSHRGDSLSLNEKASLVYRPKTSMSLEGMRRQLRSLEDLLIILTNSDYCLPWPPKITLALPLKDLTFEWYLYRIRSSADPPHWHDCLTNFVQIREIFGTIVSAWIKKREQFGPGFYLYLAVRRNWRLYTEHLFVNLIWGLEAFHRKKNTEPLASTIKERVDRLIACVVDPKDKKWLARRLKNAGEPNLELRLYELIENVPLKIELKRLRIFACRCAQIRNDISHFGEQRTGRNYQEFIDEVAQKARALSTLYHMIILYEIGVNIEAINEWIYVRSFEAKATLVEAGLLDQGVLRTQTPAQP